VDPRYRREPSSSCPRDLGGPGGAGIDEGMLGSLADEIVEVTAWACSSVSAWAAATSSAGWRAARGMDRVAADHMGMLATVITSIALQNAIRRAARRCRPGADRHRICTGLAEPYIRRRALRHLEKGRVVLFAPAPGPVLHDRHGGGRCAPSEMDAEVILKAPASTAFYDRDPLQDRAAQRFAHIGYLEVLQRGLNGHGRHRHLAVHGQPLAGDRVQHRRAREPRRVVLGEPVGTRVGETGRCLRTRFLPTPRSA